MRGRVVRSLQESAVACLLAVLMVLPAGAAPLPVAEDAGPLGLVAPERTVGPDEDSPFAWVDEVSIDTLESVAPREGERFGPSAFPLPNALPGYPSLAEADQRDAWRNWLIVSALAAVEDPGRWKHSDASEEATTDPAAATDLGEPRALRGLWSLESHGVPRAMHPADEEGGTFVVTDRGVLKFPAPGAAPAWMVKPGSYMGQTATGDANGDGVLDLILGVWGFYSDDEPSIVVVDGTDGTVLFSGLVGDERLMIWTLTDVDGDGTEDLLGVDRQHRLVAYSLDGKEIHATPLPDLPAPPPISLPLFYLSAYYAKYAGGAFADVDGDGVADLVSLSGYRGFLFAGIMFQQVSLPLLSARSGVDGSLIWQTVAERPGHSFAFTYPVASGDLDGDGMEDVLVRSTGYTFSVGLSVVESRSRVHSGLGGTVMSEDSYTFACAVVICSPPLPEGPDFFPVAFADLDADGAEELVGVGGMFYGGGRDRTVAFEGRTAPAIPGTPTETAYRHELLSGAYDEAWVARVTLRDVDGDGTSEALVSVFTAQMDEDGAIASVGIHHLVVGPDGAKGGLMPDLYGFWDYDATGTAYAWSVRDDRWGPIDDEGERIGDGFRLIVSMVPRAFYDHTGDDIPDLLLRKTLGYMWVDGKTGRLLEDIIRPIEVSPLGVHEENGRLYLLERDFARNEFALIDVETSEDAWRIDQEAIGSWWISALEDVTGDGRRDILSDQYHFIVEQNGDSPLGMVSYTYRDERVAKVFDPAVEEVVWERELQRGYVVLADALPSRAGHEILLRDRDEATSTYHLEMHVPGEDEGRWSYNLGSAGRYVASAEGYLLIQNEQEGAVYEVLVGESGEMVSAYPLPSDTDVMNVFFTPINKDRFPDLVASFVEEKGGDEYEVEVVVHDWANEKELARFPLTSQGEERFRRVEAGLYVFVPPVGFASAIVGDWDRDGLVDLAYREADRAMVRSTATGAILALAPGSGTILFTPDLNEDGRTEIGMVTDRGRLRFFAYAPEVGSLADEGESGVRVVKEVNGTETEKDAASFFEQEEGKVPMPGFALVAMAMVLLAGMLRRRR